MKWSFCDLKLFSSLIATLMRTLLLEDFVILPGDRAKGNLEWYSIFSSSSLCTMPAEFLFFLI